MTRITIHLDPVPSDVHFDILKDSAASTQAIAPSDLPVIEA